MKYSDEANFSFLNTLLHIINFSDAIAHTLSYFSELKSSFVEHSGKQLSEFGFSKAALSEILANRIVTVANAASHTYYLPVFNNDNLRGILSISTTGEIEIDFLELLRSILNEKADQTCSMLQVAFDNTQFPLCLLSFDGKVIEASDSISQVVGIKASALKKNGISAYLDEISKAKFENVMLTTQKLVSANFSNIEPLYVELNFTEQEGVTVEVRFQVIIPSNRPDKFFLLEIIDNAENLLFKKALNSINQELSENWERMVYLFEKASDPILIHRNNGEIIDVNETASAKFGVSKPKLCQQNIFDLALHFDNAAFTELLAIGNDELVKELTFSSFSGEKFIVELKAKKIRYKQEEVLLSFLRDITKRVDAQQKLAESEANYRFLIERIPSGIFLTQYDEILFANEIGAHILGYDSADGLLGNSFQQIFRGENVQQVFQILSKGVNFEEDYIPFTTKITHSDGRETFIRLLIVPTFYHEKIAHLLILQDISEEKNTERILRQAKEKAEESARLKSAFLANISHEVRTPINSITGFTQLIEMENDMPADLRNDYLKIITQNSHQLMNVVTNIIEVAEISSGAFVTTPYPVKLDEFFEGLYLEFASKVSHVDFRVISPQFKPQSPFLIDGQRLQQIIQLLVDNAFKFTHQGEVCLRYEIMPYHLKIQVSDTGVGIEKEKINSIFEAFRQGEINADNRRYGGVGVGLFIVKSLAEHLGGTIAVDSEVGKGTTFTLQFPLRFIEENNNDEEPVNYIHWPNKHILIVEDVLANALYLEEVLLDIGVRTTVVSTGSEALKELKYRNRFDLILLDIQLPDMSGYQVLEKIKSEFDIPVIAQTAYALSNDKRKVQQAGFDGYLPKPIAPDSLRELCARLLIKWDNA